MKSNTRLPLLIAALLALSACTPTVHLVVDKPIEINMNITVDIKIAVEKELDDMLSADSGLF